MRHGLAFLMAVAWAMAGWLALAGAAQAAPSSGLLTYENLKRVRGDIVAAQLRAGDGQIKMSSSLAPAVGLLLIEADGELTECTGIVISARHVLTAGHCLCGDASSNPEGYASATACQSQLQRLDVRLFLPAAGIFRLTSPRPHPAYRYPTLDAAGRAAPALPARDVAILTSFEAIPVQPARLAAAPLPQGRYALVSFGPVKAPPGARGDRPASLLAMGHMSLHQALDRGRLCLGMATPDAVCTVYETAEQTPERASTGACRGDSGSGLFEVEDGRPVRLAGLTSYVAPADDCPSAMGMRTVFMDLTSSETLAWITAVTGQVAPAPAPRCESTRLGGIEPDARLASPLVSLAVTAMTFDARFDIEGVPPDDCATLTPRGQRLTWCAVSPTVSPRVTVAKGFAQLTACWAGASATPPKGSRP